jgi:hypothetical protein
MAKAKTHKSGAAYYAGGSRYIKNGIPCRMAPWFGTMSESARAVIGRAIPRVNGRFGAKRSSDRFAHDCRTGVRYLRPSGP